MSSIISNLQMEIELVEAQICSLKQSKFDKECKVDDLQMLLKRISSETSFLLPCKITSCSDKKIKENKNVSVGHYKIRKYSDNSDFTTLSKCVSTITKASSHFLEDDNSSVNEKDDHCQLGIQRKIHNFLFDQIICNRIDNLSKAMSFWNTNLS